jgi:cytochrome c peroxidase
MRVPPAQRYCPRLAQVAIAGCIVSMVCAGIAGLLLAEPIEGEPIAPVPRVAGLDSAKIELGRKMFQDVRLSRDDKVSCTGCHHLERGGADGRVHSMGADGRPLDFNASTVFNAGLNARLNWRGNFRTLEEQNESVLLDPRLMNSRWPELLAKLRADKGYQTAFRTVYGGDPERAHVLDALATFQRSLLTPDARFDRYLRGESGAISADEARGYHLFKAYGCVACHQGVNIGGNLFQRFGVFRDPFAERDAIRPMDLGRYTITGDERDRHVFRVPSLRNVAVTAPYFHDGSVASLSEAVAIMARSQLGREVPPQDVDLIVKFLGTLTGAYQGRSIDTNSDRTQ